MKSRLNISRKTLAEMVIFSALVAAATMVFSVYVPATRGYFNVGEIMVYTSALLMGPVVGAFAGGVGSMIADITLGYTHYAPATIVIKGVEGFIVGYLSQRIIRYPKTAWRVFSSAAAVAVGLLVWTVGANYYTGEVELSLGLPTLSSMQVTFFIPLIFWLIVAATSLLFILLVCFAADPYIGWTVGAVLAGGVVMVLGYFLYETYLFGLGAALVEVPVNIGQVTVGLIVSVPLVRAVLKIVPKHLLLKPTGSHS